MIFSDYVMDMSTIDEKQKIINSLNLNDTYIKFLNISLKALTKDYYNFLNIRSITKERFFVILHSLLENRDLYDIIENIGYNFRIWDINKHNYAESINSNKDLYKITSFVFYILDYYNKNNYFPVDLENPINLNFIYREV